MNRTVTAGQREPFAGFRKPAWVLATVSLFLFSAAESGSPKAARVSQAIPTECKGVPTEVSGQRRLALLVGIGQYLDPTLRRLTEPPTDVERIRRLLTEVYGFPEENICILLDGQASTGAFGDAFEASLIERTRPGKDDLAVFYFAGHGSQIADRNGDEADGLDETFLFQDARTGTVEDFADDDLNARVARLYERTHNIVLIVDSCNSGSIDRGPAATTFAARHAPPMRVAGSARPVAASFHQPEEPWFPKDLNEVVLLAAAADGTPALERRGVGGIFTNALIEVLGSAAPERLTYAQAARRIPNLMAASSPQTPFFQGLLDREVFGSAVRPRPLAWEVQRVGSAIELSGPPTPGIGRGAELRLYAPGTDGADYTDPGKAKALLVIDAVTGLNASAHVATAPAGASPPRSGDLGVLIRPSDEAIQLVVRIRPDTEPGGLPKARGQALRQRVAEDPDASRSVVLTEGPGDFELSVAPPGRLQLRGPEDKVRNLYSTDDEVVRSLWQHARQKALRWLGPEPGAAFGFPVLQVKAVPVKRQNGCTRGPCPDRIPTSGGAQIVPLGMRWNVEVTLSEDSPVPLLVGGVMLSSDGSITGFPEGRQMMLNPGETWVFTEVFLGRPPIGTEDYIRVFGTQKSNPVDWSLLSSALDVRNGPRAPSSALYRALNRYLTPGARSGPSDSWQMEGTTWTESGLATRVGN